MKIYVGWLEDIYEECETEDLGEAKVNFIKQKAKIDNRITIDHDYLYMIEGSHNELGININNIDRFEEYMQNWDCGDWIDLTSEVSVKKEECIELLCKKIEENDNELIKEIKNEFSKGEEDRNFIGRLINGQIKYVLLNRIQELQNILVEDDFKEIEWS